jgi:hypothetical protein
MNERKSAQRLESELRRVLGFARSSLSRDDYLNALEALDELCERARMHDLASGFCACGRRRSECDGSRTGCHPCGCGHTTADHRHNDWSSCQVKGCDCAGYWNPPESR